MANFFHDTALISPFAVIDISTKGTHTYIGQDCVIDAFVRIKHVGGSGDVKIGKGVYLNSGTVIYSGNGVSIADNVLIGPNCSIVPTGHEFRDPYKLIREQRFSPSKGGVIIEEDVWLGANVILLDGSIIRRGSVIGANSLVTGELKEFTIYAGSPVKPIGFR